MPRIKGYPGTSSNFPILSFYQIQNQILSRQGHSNTFILPNIKSNRLTYHVSHQGTTSNISFNKLVDIYTKISFSRQGLINPILSFYRIQNQIGSHIMFAISYIKGQVQTSHLSNFTTRVGSIL